MEIQDKTKEELIKAFQELQLENNTLKKLLDEGNIATTCSYDAMRETNLKLTLAMQGGSLAWWEMNYQPAKSPSTNIKLKCWVIHPKILNITKILQHWFILKIIRGSCRQ
jgi:hypothetical protein